MNELISPRPVYVEVPEHSPFYPQRNMYTTFFRPQTHLSEALAFTVERVEDANRLKVMSAGCSVGAEADSVLSLHRMEGYTGHIAMKGVDINPMAIDAARTGVYKLGEYVIGGDEEIRRELNDKLSSLRDSGFDVFTAHRRNYEGELLGEPKARSTSLRLAHEVEFEGQDIRRPLGDGDYDLVLANNVLYHMPETEASQVIRNLADTLTDIGVLSFSGGYSRLSLGWIRKTAEMLRTAFSMEAIFMETAHRTPVPVMFAKT